MFDTLAKMLLVLTMVGLLMAVTSGSIIPLLVIAGVAYGLVCVYEGLTG